MSEEKIVRVTTRNWLMVGLCFGLFASAAATAEVKLAFVDVDRAVASSESAQKLLQQLQDEFASDQETIEKIQTEATALLQKMQKDSDVMSEDEKRRVGGAELGDLRQEADAHGGRHGSERPGGHHRGPRGHSRPRQPSYAEQVRF